MITVASARSCLGQVPLTLEAYITVQMREWTVQARFPILQGVSVEVLPVSTC